MTARPRTEPEADAAALTLEPEHLSDLGNARRLVRTFGENLRYVPAWRAWRVWTGASWTEDETGQVERYAKDVAAEIYVEAGYEQDERRRRELARWAIASESHRGIRGMIALAQSERGIAVPPGAFDRDPWLLNVANGTVNLKTGTLREHRRADLITKLIPVAYDPAADAPIFLDFLRRIFAGNRDLIDYVRRAVGYSLTGDTSEQVLLLCWGTGANGKTTLMQTLAMLLAGYASRLDANTLLAGKGDRGLVMNDLFGLQGARFVFAVEADMGRKLAEALVKELTGGESIRVKKLYADIFTIEPQFKLWIGTNYKPEIRGTDRAIWRRIRLVPFDVTIPESEQDRGLTERLRAEAAGILRWAIEGCLAWQCEGLGAPEAVLTATAAYRGEMDVLGDFLGECCVAEPGAAALTGTLYDRYVRWAERAGEAILTKKSFGLRLGERGLTAKRRGGVWHWLGVRLRTPADDAANAEASAERVILRTRSGLTYAINAPVEARGAPPARERGRRL